MFKRLNSKSKAERLSIRNGVLIWGGNGIVHRLDGPAIEHTTGAGVWYHRGRRHRPGSPALILPGDLQAWYWRDLKHRLDGPAVEFRNGAVEYWVLGIPVPDHYVDRMARIKSWWSTK